MTLVGCSSNVIPIKQKILCPMENRCQSLKVEIRTNRDLALALDQALNQTDICVLEVDALKTCIDRFNQRDDNP